MGIFICLKIFYIDLPIVSVIGLKKKSGRVVIMMTMKLIDTINKLRYPALCKKDWAVKTIFSNFFKMYRTTILYL